MGEREDGVRERLEELRGERWGDPARRDELERALLARFGESRRWTGTLRARPLLSVALLILAGGASFAAGAAVGGWRYWIETDDHGQEYLMLRDTGQQDGTIGLMVEDGEGERLIEVLENGGRLMGLDPATGEERER